MSEITTPPLPPDSGDKETRRTVNRVLQGKTNNFGTVTLTANATSTAISDPRIGINSVIHLQPTTANAAGALATTYFGSPGDGTVTITHANNAQTDKTFLYTVVG